MKKKPKDVENEDSRNAMSVLCLTEAAQQEGPTPLFSLTAVSLSCLFSALQEMHSYSLSLSSLHTRSPTLLQVLL